MEYPKINSLWKREGWYFDEKEKKGPQKPNRQSFIIGDYALDEFGLIKRWFVEEKIDGTNIRIIYKDGKVSFGGRTNNAQMPCHLLKYLQNTFGEWNLSKVFPCKEDEPYPSVIFFGEGYGPKIQNGGKYAQDVGFILFDVLVGPWWLKRNDIEKISEELQIPCVPKIGIMNEEEIVEYVKSRPNSHLNPEYGCMEGVICRTEPILLCRNRERVIWKLKCKEFDKKS